MAALLLTPNKYTYAYVEWATTMLKEWFCGSLSVRQNVFNGQWVLWHFHIEFWFHEIGQKSKRCVWICHKTNAHISIYWPLEISCQSDIEPDSILFVQSYRMTIWSNTIHFAQLRFWVFHFNKFKLKLKMKKLVSQIGSSLRCDFFWKAFAIAHLFFPIEILFLSSLNWNRCCSEQKR